MTFAGAAIVTVGGRLAAAPVSSPPPPQLANSATPKAVSMRPGRSRLVIVAVSVLIGPARSRTRKGKCARDGSELCQEVAPTRSRARADQPRRRRAPPSAAEMAGDAMPFAALLQV